MTKNPFQKHVRDRVADPGGIAILLRVLIQRRNNGVRRTWAEWLVQALVAATPGLGHPGPVRRAAFHIAFGLLSWPAQPLSGKACHEPITLADSLALGFLLQQPRVTNMMGGIRKIDPPARSINAPNAQATSSQGPLKRTRKKEQQIAPPKELPATVNKST
jgi:hypothetical protein